MKWSVKVVLLLYVIIMCMKTDASLFDNYRRLNIILTKFSKFLIVNQKSFNQITSVGSSNSIVTIPLGFIFKNIAAYRLCSKCERSSIKKVLILLWVVGSVWLLILLPVVSDAVVTVDSLSSANNMSYHFPDRVKCGS